MAAAFLGPRRPSFAVCSASGPARLPPNSLGDHGGRPPQQRPWRQPSSGHGAPPSPSAPHPDQLAYLRTASETTAAVLLIPHPDQLAYLRTASPQRPWRPSSEGCDWFPGVDGRRRPFGPRRPSFAVCSASASGPAFLGPRRPSFAVCSASASGPARLPPNSLGDHGGRPASASGPAFLGPRRPSFAVCSASASGPARLPPNSLGDHGGRPPHSASGPARLPPNSLASETMAAVLFIPQPARLPPNSLRDHGGRPLHSRRPWRPSSSFYLRTASETMAAVLFICALGQPLVLAHLNGFTAIGPHASCSAWSAALACNRLRIRTSSPTSERPRRPWRPSSSLCPQPASLACAPQRLHRHRPACLRLRPARCKPSAAIGSQGLTAADDPSGHGAPPSPFAPHPDQLAYLRTASETMAAVLFFPHPFPARCKPSAAIGSQGLTAADDPSGHGAPPSPFAPHPDQLAYLRTASEAMAAVLFIPHPLQAFDCNWFPGVDGRRRPFGPRRPSFAVCSASGPARLPPNSLGDHGGRPPHSASGPARLPPNQRLHRHRPACLRLSPARCD